MAITTDEFEWIRIYEKYEWEGGASGYLSYGPCSKFLDLFPFDVMKGYNEKTQKWKLSMIKKIEDYFDKFAIENKLEEKAQYCIDNNIDTDKYNYILFC